MKKIKLSQGKVTLVDDEDFDLLSKYRWHYHTGCRCEYARRSTWKDGKVGTIYMHQMIINTPPGLETDHINGNKLDNRRENLRICTTRENQHNQHRNL